MTDNLQNRTCNLKNIECYDIVFSESDEFQEQEDLLNQKLKISFDRLGRLNDKLKSIIYISNNYYNSNSSLVNKICYYKKLVKLESLII